MTSRADRKALRKCAHHTRNWARVSV